MKTNTLELDKTNKQGKQPKRRHKNKNPLVYILKNPIKLLN